MNAIRVHEFGGPEVLKYDDVALAEPKEGEVRVKIEAVGVNFIDVYRRKGLYKTTLPLTLGEEAAGVVDAVGANVTDVRVGDRMLRHSRLARRQTLSELSSHIESRPLVESGGQSHLVAGAGQYVCCTGAPHHCTG